MYALLYYLLYIQIFVSIKYFKFLSNLEFLRKMQNTFVLINLTVLTITELSIGNMCIFYIYYLMYMIMGCFKKVCKTSKRSTEKIT